MKRITILSTVLILLVGCVPDMRNNNMVPDSFGITSLENVVEASAHPGIYVVGIAKSGKGQTAAVVQISEDADQCKALVEQYNAEHDTRFVPVPPSIYTLDATSFSFTEKEVSKELILTWDPYIMVALMGDSEKYVIPILITSDSEDVKVQQKRSFLLIHMNRSSVNVSQKAITRVVEKKMVEPDTDGNRPQLQESVKLDLTISKPVKGMEISWPVLSDNSLIESYNQQHGTAYVAAPGGLVSIDTPTVTLSSGAKSCIINLTLDYSVLLKDGALPQFPSYLVPVRIDTKAASAKVGGEDIRPQGLGYQNTVTYVCIEWKETKKGFNVTRQWGLYSTADASWSDYLPDFTAGADRNVSLDGDYIYIAETNTGKNLWAISLKDAGTYKTLPVGTVKDEGVFYLSCPRVIPNTDPAINGGKPVLTVMSMNEGDPIFYVYDKGITADPTPIALTTWAGRRLGDTFTWWGSLQDGVLLLKDATSVQGTVTFWLRGKLSEQLFLVGRVQAPAVTGVGAYFPFPENVSEGIATVRNGEMAWLVKSGKDLNKEEGGDNSPALTELDAEYADAAFRFFELKGKRYIAYAKQEGSQAGRLVILEGELTDNWKQMLDNPQVVYQAAIQNDTEQEGISPEPSPRASANSGMDLDVWQSGDEVFIAVVKQNVGLSLFRVDNNEE